MLQEWFRNREGYYHVEIKHDPSIRNPQRKTLYAYGHVTWKIVSDETLPIYLGTAYMSKWVVREINDVVQKLGELYD